MQYFRLSDETCCQWHFCLLVWWKSSIFNRLNKGVILTPWKPFAFKRIVHYFYYCFYSFISFVFILFFLNVFLTLIVNIVFYLYCNLIYLFSFFICSIFLFSFNFVINKKLAPHQFWSLKIPRSSLEIEKKNTHTMTLNGKSTRNDVTKSDIN